MRRRRAAIAVPCLWYLKHGTLVTHRIEEGEFRLSQNAVETIIFQWVPVIRFLSHHVTAERLGDIIAGTSGGDTFRGISLFPSGSAGASV